LLFTHLNKKKREEKKRQKLPIPGHGVAEHLLLHLGQLWVVGLGLLGVEGERLLLAELVEGAANLVARGEGLHGQWRLVEVREHLGRAQRWVIAIKTKIQLTNTLPIILNCVIGVIN